MSSLRHIQALFCESIFEDQSGSAVNELSRYITPGPGLSPEDHVKIYRRSVLAKLAEALSEIYPVCLKLVGEAFFSAMAQTFVRRTPSRSPDLGEYGHDFGDFIEGFEPADTLPYLPDVARLEWAWHRVFHAEAAEPLDPESLAQVPADQQGRIRFHLAPSSALLESIYPIHRIWQVNQPDFDGDGRVDLDDGGIRLLVWRRGFDMHMNPLDEGTWYVLKSCQDGNDFATVCENLEQQVPNADMSTVLPELVERGWINSFSL